MSAASARQSQRVLIDAPVQLTLRDAARTLPARALDLSEGGMRLSAEADVLVGDAVTCDLELDNEHAALSGEVRWSKPGITQPGGTGIGVQFGALSEDQLGLLRRWLAHNSDHAQTVLLHVPSLREPLRARGCVTADGLQLVAALPQLAPGSELEFQLGEHGSRRVARIERVDLKAAGEKTPLELALRLQPMAATRSRRNLVYGLGEPEPEPVLLPAPQRAAPAFAAGAPTDSGRPRRVVGRRRPSSRHETIEIPRTTTGRLIRAGGWILAAGLASIWLLTRMSAPEQDSEPAPRASLAPSKSGSKARSETSTSSATAPPAAAAARPQSLSQPAVPVDSKPQVAAQTSVDAANDSAAKSSPEATANPAAERKPEATAMAAVAPSAAAPATTTDAASSGAASAAAPAEARMPALNASGAKSEIFVPMQGTLNGLRSTQWTEPLAVVLDLPNAHIDAPELLRGLRGGGVRRVRLDETRPVPRLQIFLNTVAARFAARSVPNGLLVVLEHDLHPMPN